MSVLYPRRIVATLRADWPGSFARCFFDPKGLIVCLFGQAVGDEVSRIFGLYMICNTGLSHHDFDRKECLMAWRVQRAIMPVDSLFSGCAWTYFTMIYCCAIACTVIFVAKDRYAQMPLMAQALSRSWRILLVMAMTLTVQHNLTNSSVFSSCAQKHLLGHYRLAPGWCCLW